MQKIITVFLVVLLVSLDIGSAFAENRTQEPIKVSAVDIPQQCAESVLKSATPDCSNIIVSASEYASLKDRVKKLTNDLSKRDEALKQKSQETAIYVRDLKTLTAKVVDLKSRLAVFRQLVSDSNAYLERCAAAKPEDLPKALNDLRSMIFPALYQSILNEAH